MSRTRKEKVIATRLAFSTFLFFKTGFVRVVLVVDQANLERRDPLASASIVLGLKVCAQSIPLLLYTNAGVLTQGLHAYTQALHPLSQLPIPFITTSNSAK